MKKDRLFVLGDSFVDWNVPKHHWTWYLEKHYEVIKLGKFGADNYSILFQLGHLPEYQTGDRLIIYFTDPGRLPRRYYGERKEQYLNTPYMSPKFYNDSNFADKLHELKYDEQERWINGSREVEVQFLSNLKYWLRDYIPIFLTWSETFHLGAPGLATFLQVSTNWQEGVGEERDFHPGPKGCYQIYRKCHELLNISDSIASFEEHIKSPI